MLVFFVSLIAIYLIISVMIAGSADVLLEFLIALAVLSATTWLIFRYLIE